MDSATAILSVLVAIPSIALFSFLAVSAWSSARRGERAERLQLSGLILVAIGIGVMVFLHALVHDVPVYSSGLLPLLIGAALLGYSYTLAHNHV